MRFIATQIGARRGYAVPAILESAGMLERFYTEICGSVGLGSVLSRGMVFPGCGQRIRRLAGRRLPDAILTKTRTFDRIAIKHGWRTSRVANDPCAVLWEWLRFVHELGEAMIRAGFGRATHVYTMISEAGPFPAEARRRGLQVVAEIYILLSAPRILAEERRAFPTWEPELQDSSSIGKKCYAEDPLLKNMNYAICPSMTVRDDLVNNYGFPRAKTAIVPYGMDPEWLKLKPRPVRGRALFVGSAALRKGIHYFAMAAETLARRGVHYEFRVAGEVRPRVAEQSVCRHLTFMGRVPRHRIQEEFQRADILVLPTLAEGSAEVIYEALASGVPVVTTLSAGSIVRDGIEGRIVPERDVKALALAMEELMGDRQLREHMAEAARLRARDYTWDRYGQRLVSALRGFGEVQEQPSCETLGRMG